MRASGGMPSRGIGLHECLNKLPQLRRLCFHFLSHWMGSDRGDSFPLDSEPNGIPFGSENRKENRHHDQIPFNVKGNGNIIFSVWMNVWQNCRRMFFYNDCQIRSAWEATPRNTTLLARRFPSYFLLNLLSYFFSIFYLLRCTLPYPIRLLCHIYIVVVEHQSKLHNFDAYDAFIFTRDALSIKRCSLYIYVYVVYM